MAAVFEKEFAVPRRGKRWSLKGIHDGIRTHPAVLENMAVPGMAPIENISSLMTVGNENFKWTPEKNKEKPSTPEDVFTWSMPFMKLRFLLCFLGALPITWKKPYTPSTHPVQSTLLYCIAVYAGISVSVGVAASDLIGMLSNAALNQDQRVMDLELTIELVAHLLTPILWIDSHCQSDGFDAWASLMKDFFRVTGRKLVNRRVGMELAFSLSVITLPTLGGFLMAAMVRGFDLKMSYAPAYFHAGMVQCGMTLLWIGTCLTLGDVADEITNAFQESTDKHGATPEILVEYRRLWVMLRSLSDLMGSMVSPLFMVTHTLVLITLLLYEGLIFLNRGETVSGITHICGSVMFVGSLFFVCRASHFTALHMKSPLESVLDTLPVANLSTTAEREVIMFYLVENAKPAVTTLNGFVIVNKSLFSSMLAAVSTYLIVLMQFHQSSDGFSSRNTTVSFI